MNYITKLLLGVDQFANTIIGGSPDETISARAGRRRHAPGVASRLWWKPLAWGLDKLQKDHTLNAIKHETDGSQQESSYAEVFDPEDTCQVLQEVQVEVKVDPCDIPPSDPGPTPTRIN